MAKARGKDAVIKITTVAGGTVDITPFVDGFDSAWESETYDTTGYGMTNKEKLRGFGDWTGSITGKWDNAGSATPEQYFPALIQADGTVTSTLTNYPNGTAAGKAFERAAVYFANYAKSQPYDNVNTWSVDYELANGSVTNGTV